MKTKLYFFLFLSLFIVGTLNSLEDKKHTRIFYGTLEKACQYIEKKYKLTCTATGGKALGGPITLFRLCFDIRAPLSREQLRNILIKSSKDFLSIVNSDQEVQPYLAKRPFTLENIEIIIFNNDKTGRDVCDPIIAVADINKNGLSFQTNEPENEFAYKNTYKETYEEALKTVQEH